MKQGGIDGVKGFRIALALAAMLTTASAPGFPPENALLTELNKLRADPKGYAAELRDFRKGFRGSIHYAPGENVGWQTEEGIAAVDEAIAVLDRQTPLPSVGAGSLLAQAASDHGGAQAKDGTEGHIGSDGTDPGDRVARRGGDVFVAEVIAYGSTSAADAMRQLIIDDGVADRGHRVVLLDPSYRFAGAWCGPHPVWRQVCVMTLATTPDGTDPEVGTAEGA